MSAATAWALPADCTCTPDRCRGESCDSCWRRHGCPVDEPAPLADRDVLHAVCLCTDGEHARTEWAGEYVDPAARRVPAQGHRRPAARPSGRAGHHHDDRGRGPVVTPLPPTEHDDTLAAGRVLLLTAGTALLLLGLAIAWPCASPSGLRFALGYVLLCAGAVLIVRLIA